jgi:Asp-tRNA(Asn)/Glu-tRNA(Gln) amidotransferase A subunit family amidase
LTSRRLTEIFRSRIDAIGPKLECYAAVTAKRALAEADAADSLLRGGVGR